MRNFKNSVSRYLRPFISNSFIRKVIKAMHINKIGKNLYFNLFVPKGKKISHKIESIDAEFYIRDYTDLLYLTETIVGDGDERSIIKLVLDSIKKGDIIYDIGAFLGTHTIFFAKKTGETGCVIAFEPSLASFEALKNNIELNNLKNIIPLSIALGGEKKEAILRGNDSSSYSLSAEFDRAVFNQKTIIMPGDLVVKDKNLPTANIIKIDVEGYEYEVIKGLQTTLKNNACKLVCCEVHPNFLPHGVTSDMVINLLKSFGFMKVNIFPRGDIFHAFCYKVNI